MVTRFVWLNPKHPIAVKDARWTLRAGLPRLLQRMSNVWTMLGYAAVIHGTLFLVSVLTYQQFTNSQASAILSALSPFLTPFGTPITAALIHSLIYWAMLIGVVNQTAVSFAAEFEQGSWEILRLTPFNTQELALAKAAAVGRQWWAILRALTVIRLCSALIIPIAVLSQRTREITSMTLLDAASIGVFLVQPFAEGAMLIGLTIWIAALTQDRFWSRILGIGTAGVALGVLNGIGAIWLTFFSPLGSLGAMLLPLGHWTPLAATAIPPQTTGMYLMQVVVFALCVVIIPIVIGWIGLKRALIRLG